MAEARSGFGNEQTRERLAIVENELKHVGNTVDDLRESVAKLDDKVDGVKDALDALRLELAKKRTDPPPSGGWTIPKVTQQAVGGVIGAALLYLVQAVAGPALPAVAKPAVAVTASHSPQTHDGP